MKKNILITLLAAVLLSSCGEYNKLLKSTDYEYKYEAAKNYFAKGQYNRAATLLNELIAILKGTDKAEESLYMLGMSYYNQKDYQTAAQTFVQYFNVYPRGTFTELARFHAGKATVTGFADNGTGNREINLRLAKQRAEAVAKQLTEKYGISRDRLTVSSMQDKEQPFQTNDWNRVVVIIAD